MRDPNPRRERPRLRAPAARRHRGRRWACSRTRPPRLNERFVWSPRRARAPSSLLKAAMTLDGRIATAARRIEVDHEPRAAAAARAPAAPARRRGGGLGTVLADDPLLLPAPRTRRPFHRVVFDSRLRTPLRSRLVSSACDDAAPVDRDHGRGGGAEPRSRGRGARSWPRPRATAASISTGRCGSCGAGTVEPHGGGRLGAAGALLAARLFDQVALFRAPLLLGGRDSLPAFGGPDPARLSDAASPDPSAPSSRA